MMSKIVRINNIYEPRELDGCFSGTICDRPLVPGNPSSAREEAPNSKPQNPGNQQSSITKISRATGFLLGDWFWAIPFGAWCFRLRGRFGALQRLTKAVDLQTHWRAANATYQNTLRVYRCFLSFVGKPDA